MSSSTVSKAERTAAQAWDYLSSAMAETVSKAAAVAGDKSQELGGKADEAWARANAAAAALAGRKPGRPWGLLVLAGLAGAAAGFAAATYARAALARQAEAEEREINDTAVIVAGHDA